jgi:hypothetical protein
VATAPIYYSCLRETKPIRDISNLDVGAIAAAPATMSIYAVHVADGEIACGYVRKASDIDGPMRDWFDVASGEPLCGACLKVIQPDPKRRAPRRI